MRTSHAHKSLSTVLSHPHSHPPRSIYHMRTNPCVQSCPILIHILLDLPLPCPANKDASLNPRYSPIPCSFAITHSTSLQAHVCGDTAYTRMHKTQSNTVCLALHRATPFAGPQRAGVPLPDKPPRQHNRNPLYVEYKLQHTPAHACGCPRFPLCAMT